MNFQTITKELRIDWDNVLNDNFNPLHLALSINKNATMAANFRDMYHKLEDAMEQIININFKGFSDSVLSYNMFYSQNQHLLKNLYTCQNITQLQEYDCNLKEITDEFTKSEYFGAKYEICRKLLDIKITYEEFELTSETIKKCYQLVKCLDLIDNKEYIKIKGVFEYRKLIYQSYIDLTEQINIEIFDFIFYNKINNSFKCLLILGSLYELETFVKSYFQIYVFNSIETLIVKMYKEDIDLEKLSKQIMNKLDNIIKNYEAIIELTLNNFKLQKTGEDFFGNQNESYKYVVKLEYVLDIIKDELNNFINKYSISTEFSNKFSVENIIDTIDYNKIYPSEYNIFKNRCNKSIKKKGILHINNTQYTLITTPHIEITNFLLKYAENTMLRIFLNQRIEIEYTKFKLEKNKKKIDYIFDSEIKIDPLSKRLSLLNDIYEILNFQKKSNENSNYHNQLLKYFNKKIKNVFKKIYYELFKADIVIVPQDKIFIYDGDKNGFIYDDKINFKESVTSGYLKKINLMAKKSQYQKAIYTLNTLQDLDKLICSRETSDCYEVFFTTLKRQINYEFFYYFDLYYRESNLEQSYYIKKIVSIFELIYNESKNTLLFDELYDNLIYYCKTNLKVFNAKNKDEVIAFLNNLKIFDEIMGEIEFYDSLNPLYSFFNDILEGKSTDEDGKILQAKLRINSR